jgi:hypothetical protein
VRAYTIEDLDFLGELGAFYWGTAPADERGIKITTLVIDAAPSGTPNYEFHLPIKLTRGWTTGPVGGATQAAVPLDRVDSAAGATWEMEAGAPTGGTAVNLLTMGFNVRGGWRHQWPHREAPMGHAPATAEWVVLAADYTDSADVLITQLTVTFVELTA